jgi:hypothetical protein
MERAQLARGSHLGRVWKLLAFLGRYAHQPVVGLLGLPVDDLERLADATASILREEAEAAKPKG